MFIISLSIQQRVNLNGVTAALSLTAPSSELANVGTASSKFTLVLIFVQNANLSEKLSTCLGGCSHTCRQVQCHQQVVQHSDVHIKVTVTSALISPAEKEP